MNEKEFLKEIKNCTSLNISTYDIIDKLFREQETMMVDYKKTSIWKKIFNIHKKVKTVPEIVIDNFETILKNTKDGFIGVLFQEMNKHPELDQIFKVKFDEVLDMMKYKEISYFDVDIIFEKYKDVMKEDEFYDIDKILNSIPKKYLFDVAQILKGISPKEDEKLNKILEENKFEVVKSILDRNVCTKEKNIDEYTETLAIMIDELLKSENTKFIDIEKKGKGTYSTVYQIGDKVLKIGKERRTYNVPNHSKILKPLARLNFKERESKRIFACIEIADKIELLTEQEMQDNKLYELYKELREDGIIWADARFENIGKLKKENVPTLNGEKINVEPKAVGFEGAQRGKDLNIGDWVIIDTDFIYTKDDCNIVWNQQSQIYEKEYQQEVAAKIAQKHSNENNKEKEERECKR